MKILSSQGILTTKRRLKSMLLVLLIALISHSCGSSYSNKVIEKHPDGSTKLIHYFKEKAEGDELYKSEEFYENGIKRMEGFYKNNQPHGRWTSRYSDGTLWSTGEYHEGNLHGIQTVYHPNGQKYYEGSFDNGIRIGEWKFWDESGTLVNTRKY